LPSSRSPVSASRRAGRPADRPGQQVRAQLVAAARELFARHGFEGVSLRQVADAAGVTPAMVSYYFGGKQGLWRAVLEDYLEEALEGMLTMRDRIEAPGGLAVYLARHTQLLAAQPWVAPLLFREVVLGGRPSAEFVARFPARLRELLRGAVERARDRGEIAAGLDTDLLVLSLLSAAVFPFLVRPLIERLLDQPVDADFAARWATHAHDLFSKGVAP
jgi:TetR/AcrR family transcriptional regulator